MGVEKRRENLGARTSITCELASKLRGVRFDLIYRKERGWCRHIMTLNGNPALGPTFKSFQVPREREQKIECNRIGSFQKGARALFFLIRRRAASSERAMAFLLMRAVDSISS